jgi:hypothetical protein
MNDRPEPAWPASQRARALFHSDRVRGIAFSLLICLAALSWCYGSNVAAFRDVTLVGVSVLPWGIVEPGRRLPAPDEPVLIVTVATRSDLNDFARAYEVAPGYELSLCADRDVDSERLVHGMPYLYDQSGRTIMSPYAARKEPSSDRHLYTFRVPIVDTDGHDLRTSGEDMCFVLRGYNMIAQGFRSNTVVIPRSTFKAATAVAVH